MNESSGSNIFSQDNNVMHLMKLNDELSKKNEDLNENVCSLKKEKLELQSYIKKLQTECMSSQNPIENNVTNDPSCQRNHLNFSSNIVEHFSENSINTVNKTAQYICSENLIIAQSVPVTHKWNNDTEVHISEQVIQQNNNEKCLLQECDMSDNISDNVQSGNGGQCLKNIYLTEILSDFRVVVDDTEKILSKSKDTLALPQLLKLRKIQMKLSKILSICSDSTNFSNIDNFIDNFMYCFKTFTSKHENAIDSLQEKIHVSVQKNQNLYSQSTTLKYLLRSYGFLKMSKEKMDVKSCLLPLNKNSFSQSTNNATSFDIPHDPLLKRTIVPLMPVFNSMLLKLHNLNEQLVQLQSGLDTTHTFNDYLISSVQDQEINLRGISKELEEAQHVLSVLKNQHKKLQSAKSISKYDLQEKRKLLIRLREQLENTREDFNLVRIKNSKSEAEWQDLRKEFMQRHKQTSEESGFADDKGSEECESACSNSICDSSSPEAVSESITLNNAPQIIYQEVLPKKSRLEVLEEQCQHLYSSLLQSSKRHLEIDKHLEDMCKRIEKSNSRYRGKGDFKVNSTQDKISNESNKNTTDTSVENVIFTPDNFVTSTPYPNSDVESYHSEFSYYVPGVYSNNTLSDCESLLIDSSCSVSPYKIEINHIHSSDEEKQDNQDSFCSSKETAQILDLKTNKIADSSRESLDMCHNAQYSHLLVKSYSLDSLWIDKGKIEEDIKNLAIDGISAVDLERCSNFATTSCYITLEKEKKELIYKVKELEKENFILSNKLEGVRQQLILTQSSKEHEVSSLKLQLKTEAFKYESSLKEFSEQGKSLESMKQRISEQEDLILALEEALNEIRLDRENEKEEQWQELEDIHNALEAREEECVALSQDLEKSLSDIEMEKNKNELLISQLEDLKAFSERDKVCIISELVDLQNDSKKLKKKLIKLLKEKDLLWKSNNHFYHLQQVKINGRWMKDSEVRSCLGCKNMFSFILRKHHCRLCGRIFCYSCANNWLLTTASSKKMRACNECFVQYIEMKKDVRRGSDLPHVEESEDEEYITDLQSRDNSFDHETSPSTTISVISLPITKMQKSPHFSSVPDLRCVTNLKVSPHYRTHRLKEISTDDIKAFEYGCSSEFTINFGEQVFLPIFCHTSPILLEWSFKSNFQDIPITITYTGETCDNEPITTDQEKQKMQDKMKLSNAGYYVFHFDNRFRNAELKIQYKFYCSTYLKQPSTDD